MRRIVVVGIAAAALLWCADNRSEVWKFDSTTKIGGHAVTAEGHPRVIATPGGKAVEFGGVDDALFLNVHPLAGVDAFTWEVIFRPDVGGAAEQRFFHFQEKGTETRMLFEIRVIDGKWCLDSFAYGIEGADGSTAPSASRGGGVRRKVSARGRPCCDQRVHLARRGADFGRTPQWRTSRGAVLEARMMNRALSPTGILKMPAG
jgi:hypothetical protein